MGSGGLIIMDEDDCMIDVAKFYLDFSRSMNHAESALPVVSAENSCTVF